MRNDILLRRFTGLDKYRYEDFTGHTKKEDILKSFGCVFYTPLTSSTETYDLINGGQLEASSHSYTSSSYDEQKGMWYFKLGKYPSTGSWAQRIKTNWKDDTFLSNEITVIAKVQIKKPSEQKSIKTLIIAKSTSGSYVSTGNINNALCLMPNNGTQNTNTWNDGVDTPDIFATIVTPEKRQYYSGDTFGEVQSVEANHLPNSFLSAYNGYIHFGCYLESSQKNTEYWISHVMVFNRELSQEQIKFAMNIAESTQPQITRRCIKSLDLMAEDVNGDQTSTLLYYKAVSDCVFGNKAFEWVEYNTKQSELFQENKTKNPINKEASITIGLLTAKTNFIQGPYPDQHLYKYMGIEAIDDGLTVSFSQQQDTLYYLIADNNDIPLSSWTKLEQNQQTNSINKGEKIYFKGNCTVISNDYGIGTFTISKKCKLINNCSSLIYDGQEKLTLSTNYIFRLLFANNANITEINLGFLPFTTLSKYCYYEMFKGCTGIEVPPEIAANRIQQASCRGMFSGCTKLLSTPQLSGKTTTTDSCYQMFLGCTSLINTCDLTIGGQTAFYEMFKNCTSLVVAPKILGSAAYSNCCTSMFNGCRKLTTVHKLPATTLYSKCYQAMFKDCTSLMEVPEDMLPAAIIENYSYAGMFIGCTKLNNSPKIQATTIKSMGCYEMFSGCTSLVTMPELPATNISGGCYQNMFYNCSNLKNTVEELPATNVPDNCYYKMFYNCYNITKAPKLPALKVGNGSYREMFSLCSNLVQAPELMATYVGSYGYHKMFQYCRSLTFLIMLVEQAYDRLSLAWVLSDTGANGTLVISNNWKWKDLLGDPSTGSYTVWIPKSWQIKNYFTPEGIVSLSITADDVIGNIQQTNIYYTVEIGGFDYNNSYTTETITGVAKSDIFPINPSTTDTIQREITFTYEGVTATTTITQGVWIDRHYTINLNSQWQQSSVTNPDSSLYDGVYESYSNKGVHNSGASMYITIKGYSNFKLYIRSYAESSCDYVMVSQLDKTLTYSSSYSDTSLVKSHTRSSQNSGTALSNYKLVEFTGIDESEHTIQIIYRKDSSANSGNDCGYVLIPKDQ